MVQGSGFRTPEKEESLRHRTARSSDLGDRDADGRVVLNTLWREVVPGRVSSVALAASSGDVVIAERRGRVTAYDILGVRRWEFDCRGAQPRVAATADGLRAAVLADGTLWWINESGEVVWRKTDLTGLTTVAVDPWARRIVCAGQWKRSCILSAAGREVGRLDALLVVSFMELASLSDMCICASDFGDLCAFDAAGNCLWQHRLSMPVADLAVSQSGELILLASPQHRVFAYDGEGRRLGTYAVGEGPQAVACTWSGSSLFFANAERQLLMMRRQGGLRFLQNTSEPLVALASDMDGRRLLTLGRSGEVSLVSVNQADAHRTSFLEVHEVPRGESTTSATVSARWRREIYPLTEYLAFGRLAVSAGGRLVGFVDARQRLVVFDRSGTQLTKVRLRGAFPDLRRAAKVDALLVYTDRSLLVVRQGEAEPVVLTTPRTGVAEARIAEDASLVLSADEFGEVSLYGVEDAVYWRARLDARPDALAISRRDNWAVAAGDGGQFVAWGLDGSQLWRRTADIGDILDLHVLGDVLVIVCRGGVVAAVSRRGEVVWRRASEGRLLRTYCVDDRVVLEESDGVLVLLSREGEEIDRRQASARDALLVRGERGGLLLLDVLDEQVRCLTRTKELLWKYDSPDHVKYLSANADGTVVAVVSGRTLELLQPGGGEGKGSDLADFLEW